MLPTTEEKKRSELIDELVRRHEPVIARAVESAPGCRLENGVLYLDYQRYAVHRLGKGSYGR